MSINDKCGNLYNYSIPVAQINIHDTLGLDATVELPFTMAVLEKLVSYLYSGQLACEDMSLQSLRELNLGKFPLSDCVEALDHFQDSITETLQSIVTTLKRLKPIGK